MAFQKRGIVTAAVVIARGAARAGRSWQTGAPDVSFNDARSAEGAFGSPLCSYATANFELRDQAPAWGSSHSASSAERGGLGVFRGP